MAAEAIAGEKSFFDARVIPSVAYTDPEIAWVGITEDQAKEEGIEVQKGIFGADMQVSLVNDGPVTIMLEK